MRRHHALVLASLVVASTLVALWQRADTQVSRTHPVAASTAVPVAAPEPDGAPRPIATPSSTDLESAEGEAAARQEERIALLRRDPDLADRMRQDELAPAADARWEESVARGGYRAEDLDAAVRDVFRRVDLAPRYAGGGRIEGLLIRDMPSDHPFAQAGFRAGDLIDRIQGVELRDPADLPSLLAHLGPNFSLCAARDDGALCRDLQLE